MGALNETQNVLLEIFNLQKNIPNTLGLVFLLLVILIVLKNGQRDKFKKFPPGPTGIPILGYLPFLGKDPCKTFDNLSKKYGNVFGFYLGRKYFVVCNDWEAKKDAFNKIALANRPPGLFDALPNGLGFASDNGQVWNEQRRYSMKIVKDVGLGTHAWEEMLQEKVNEIVRVLENNQGKPISLEQLLSSCFTDSMMALLFGNRLPNNHHMMLFLSETMDEVTKAFFPLSFAFLSPNVSSLLYRLGFYGSKETTMRLRKLAAHIENAVKRILRNEENSSETSFVELYNKAVKSNKQLNLKNSFTETSLYSNTQTLLLGGSGTTKSATVWLLIAMANYPEVQRKVHEELDNTIGQEGHIKWSERNEIPYTYACILESLRWVTLVPINTLRMASEDTEILGYHIPKNTYVTSNNWAIHKETKYWPDPEKFDPERFLVNKKLKQKLEGFTAFSNGKRKCPGEHIALVSILQFFTRLMQKFEVQPEDGKAVKYEMSVGLTLITKGSEVRFIPRRE